MRLVDPLRLALVAGAIWSTACEGVPTTERPGQPPEDAWLSGVGTGAGQTARVCGRGAADRVATVLCRAPAASIHSLDDLYRALQLEQVGDRLVAATTHSLGLSARSVSGANPRVLVFANTSSLNKPLEYEQIVAVGFSRGEQLVELVGLDPTTYEYNFYLLRFEQPCNASRCTPEDLLTERVESGWTDWTLYSDHDLEDTPLDCLTCHLPFGTGSHKLLQMRQVIDPWMHWSDFRGGSEDLCPNPPTNGAPDRVVATSSGLEPIAALEGSVGHYAGVALGELELAKSGAVLASFLVDAELLIQASPHPPYPYEQLAFETREILCERFYNGTSATWDQERQESLSRGLPVPYYGPDVYDPKRHPEVLADRQTFLRRRAGDDAFDVASSLLSPEVAPAVGFAPREEDSAPDILRGMCVRCHAASADPNLRRARFNAQSIDRVDPSTFQAIRARLSLPKYSPELMPPRRVGELPAWAVERIEGYLREHCATPGACE
jgi:hypothetical protein